MDKMPINIIPVFFAFDKLPIKLLYEIDLSFFLQKNKGNFGLFGIFGWTKNSGDLSRTDKSVIPCPQSHFLDSFSLFTVHDPVMRSYLDKLMTFNSFSGGNLWEF